MKMSKHCAAPNASSDTSLMFKNPIYTKLICCGQRERPNILLGPLPALGAHFNFPYYIIDRFYFTQISTYYG